MDYTILFFGGILSGLLTSLFGLGGGLTIVPTLVLCLPFFHVPQPIVMHMAIGTSLAVMLINNLNAMIVHHKARHIDWAGFKKMALFVLIGAVLGATTIAHLSTLAVTAIFVLFLIPVLGKFIFCDTAIAKQTTLPGVVLVKKMYLLLVGALAASVGGGCSLLMVPYLKRRGYVMKQATALVVAFNVLIATTAVISYSLLGIYTIDSPLKFSTGYIYWPAFIFLLVGASCGIPLGLRLSKHLSEEKFSKYYLLLILVVFVIMSVKLYELIPIAGALS